MLVCFCTTSSDPYNMLLHLLSIDIGAMHAGCHSGLVQCVRMLQLLHVQRLSSGSVVTVLLSTDSEENRCTCSS